MDPRIQTVIGLMQNEGHRKLFLSDLAKSVNMSVSYLCRLFKEQTGRSPAQYLKALRLQRAKELLETTFLMVKEIAFRVGFNDVSHFVRDFKNAYGLTPALYRKHHHAGTIAKERPDDLNSKSG